MRGLIFKLLFFLPCICFADEAQVIAVEAEPIGGQFYRFTVTVKHNDEDWDHYVKSWEILDMNGKILSVRALRHPHVNEQPFTRSTTAIIPDDVDQVIIRAYDSVHKYGGTELMIYLNKETNP